MKFERNHWGLKYWGSDDWIVAHDNLCLERFVSPDKNLIFKALEMKPEEVKVAIIGQDPYPGHGMATGIAFSVPKWIKKVHWPPTFQNFIAEYQSDTGFPEPATGDLSPWVSRGVLLWNAIPTCKLGIPLSHNWKEWHSLNIEILSKLRCCVIVLLGGAARAYRTHVPSDSLVVEASHPSPRGSLNSKKPFKGSRIFTTINGKLKELGKEPINWRL